MYGFFLDTIMDVLLTIELLFFFWQFNIFCWDVILKSINLATNIDKYNVQNKKKYISEVFVLYDLGIDNHNNMNHSFCIR
jgi:hypothetical protein